MSKQYRFVWKTSDYAQNNPQYMMDIMHGVKSWSSLSAAGEVSVTLLQLSDEFCSKSCVDQVEELSKVSTRFKKLLDCEDCIVNMAPCNTGGVIAIVRSSNPQQPIVYYIGFSVVKTGQDNGRAQSEEVEVPDTLPSKYHLTQPSA